MVTIDQLKIRYNKDFQKILRKTDKSVRLKVKKQIIKIIQNPEIGKPMKYARKGTR